MGQDNWSRKYVVSHLKSILDVMVSYLQFVSYCTLEDRILSKHNIPLSNMLLVNKIIVFSVSCEQWYHKFYGLALWQNRYCRDYVFLLEYINWDLIGYIECCYVFCLELLVMKLRNPLIHFYFKDDQISYSKYARSRYIFPLLMIFFIFSLN